MVALSRRNPYTSKVLKPWGLSESEGVAEGAAIYLGRVKLRPSESWGGESKLSITIFGLAQLDRGINRNFKGLAGTRGDLARIGSFDFSLGLVPGGWIKIWI